MAETPIGWYVQFKIAPGKLEAFTKAAEETIATVQKTEPGTRMYQWFLSEDRSTAHIHEWFADQKGALAHATGLAVQDHLPKLMAMGGFARIDVFGDPEPALAKVLEAFPVTTRNRHFRGYHR